VELPVAVAVAVVAALVTLVLCDLAGSIARAKGRSYWLFFGLGLLLWFPGLIAAIAMRDPGADPSAWGRSPGRLETAGALLVMVLAVVALAAGAAAAVVHAA
jgi:hypothetical protein